MRRSRLGRKRPGHHLVICDLSGWKCWDDEVMETWDGLIVNKKFYEERHPQDFVRGGKDDTSVFPHRGENEDAQTCWSVYLDEEEVYTRTLDDTPVYVTCIPYNGIG